MKFKNDNDFGVAFKSLMIFFAIVLVVGMLVDSTIRWTSRVAPPRIEIIFDDASCEGLKLEEEALSIMTPRYGFTEEEVWLLAQVMWGEYRFSTTNPDWDQINKVMMVIMNRVEAPGLYADTISEVIFQPGAFVVIPRALSIDPGQDFVNIVREWCYIFDWSEGFQPIPNYHFWFSADGRGGNITRGVYR